MIQSFVSVIKPFESTLLLWRENIFTEFPAAPPEQRSQAGEEVLCTLQPSPIILETNSPISLPLQFPGCEERRNKQTEKKKKKGTAP